MKDDIQICLTNVHLESSNLVHIMTCLKEKYMVQWLSVEWILKAEEIYSSNPTYASFLWTSYDNFIVVPELQNHLDRGPVETFWAK